MAKTGLRETKTGRSIRERNREWADASGGGRLQRLLMSTKFRNFFLGAFTAFCLLLLILVWILNEKSQADSEKILAKSVRSGLLAACVAAREVIDPVEFAGLLSVEDTREDPNYAKTLKKLRSIAASVGAKYIYALKRVGGEYVFVYDTDPEEDTVFIPYELSQVHKDAFAGKAGADLLNVQDIYGTFSTGAMPIYLGDQVIGVVSADIEDQVMMANRDQARFNTRLLLGTILATMLAMAFVMAYLLRKIKEMQDRLTTMAHYDAVTGLPNRMYLLEYLQELKNQPKNTPFALLFIDLDNFKQVNDVAGHDAGDALLKRIGDYLGRQHGPTRDSRVFRPTAGRLNVAARVGGDEFVIVAPHVGSRVEAEHVAGDILRGLNTEKIDDHIQKFHVGMSIGIALYPSQAEDYNVLIKYADIAMYHAKNSGKNCYRVYEDEMAARAGK